MRSALRRLPACRECVRAWRRLAGGKFAKDGQRRTLVACSGGVDSTALLLCLWAAAGEHVVVGHVVHDMRAAEEAESDAAAVQQLCERLGVGFARSRVRVHEEAGNAEAAARRLRYDALARVAVERRCTFVATGHQGDDQLETMLMRLVRGAGPRGLAGIMPARVLGVNDTWIVLVRPLLGLTRADAEQVCRAAGVAWREDATNADAMRWRARLRRDVVPVLKQLRPDVARRALTAAALMREAAESVEWQAADLVDQALDEGGRLVWMRSWIDDVGIGVLGEVFHQARNRLLGDAAADRLRARDVEAVARGLRDPDRRARSWEIAGMRVKLDRDGFSIGRADRAGSASDGRRT